MDTWKEEPGNPCWAVWAPCFGNMADMNDHAMVWCVNDDDAKGIAAFESNFTGIEHNSYLGECSEMPLLQEVAHGIFVKDDGAAKKCTARVLMALKALSIAKT